MREIDTELNDKVALLAWFVGVRHSLTRHCLLVARTATIDNHTCLICNQTSHRPLHLDNLC